MSYKWCYMNKINKCKNCKYFIQHYAKKTNKFKSVGYGHCLCRNKRSGVAHMPDDTACKSWEQAEPNEEKRQTIISDTLDNIYTILKELTEILSAEN